MMSGVPIGGSIAALVGIQHDPALGWESMFLVAVLALVIVVPLGVKYLPETCRSAEDTNPEEADGFRALLRAPYLGVSVLFAAATIATLFAWYGLGTWLPGLMQQAGYNLGSALTFALALNLGAVVGSILTAWAGTGSARSHRRRRGRRRRGRAADHRRRTPGRRRLPHAGPRRRRHPRHPVPHHRRRREPLSRAPARDRAGLGAGTGRIGAVAAPQVGGLLLAAGLGVNSNFLAFAGAAAIAAVLLAAVGLKLKSKLISTSPSLTGASNV